MCDMFASEEPEKAAAWNKLELLRDPSHVRCLSLSELRALLQSAGLTAPREGFYEMRDIVRNLLSRSFPNPGDDVKITAMFDKHVDDGSLGLPPAHRDGQDIHYAYPVAVLSGQVSGA